MTDAQLADQVIVLYFLPLHQDYAYSRMSISCLKDTYKFLQLENGFEVVLVSNGTADVSIFRSDYYYAFRMSFESRFYYMPWTAIPFEDTKSIERLVSRFGIDRLSVMYLHPLIIWHGSAK